MEPKTVYETKTYRVEMIPPSLDSDFYLFTLYEDGEKKFATRKSKKMNALPKHFAEELVKIHMNRKLWGEIL